MELLMQIEAFSRRMAVECDCASGRRAKGTTLSGDEDFN
jgi:hypothetical protein